MWWFFFFFLLIAFIRFPAPKDQKPNTNVQFNTTSSSRNIPCFAGKVLYKGQNVFWYGGLRIEAITEKVKTGFFSSKRVQIGSKYYLSAAVGIGYGPGVKVHEIRFGDKIGWTGTLSTEGQTITIDKKTLFGDEKQEGGVAGLVEFYPGSATQSPSALFASGLGDVVPAFKKFSYLYFDDFYWGNSPNTPQVNIVASRYPDPLNLPAIATVDDGANASFWIYEILTNTRWGLGRSVGRINTASFTASAQTLFDESFGINLIFDEGTDANDMIFEILRHVNGTVYSNLFDGQVHFDLIRDDYIVGNLFVLDDTIIKKIEGTKRTARENIASEVKVRYYDEVENYKEQIEVANDTGARFMLGYPITADLQYLGIRKKAIANKIAWRELRTLSSALAFRKIICNRKAIEMYRGQPFVLSSALHGISTVICRVQDINFGKLESGEISINCVEDAFAFGSAVFSDTPQQGGLTLFTNPANVTQRFAIEIPYYVLNGLLDVSLLSANDSYVQVFPVKNNLDWYSYELLSSLDNVNFTEETEVDFEFTPYAELVSQLLISDLASPVITYQNENSVSGVAVGDLGYLINGTVFEVFSVEAHDLVLNQLTIKRGILDTIPKTFPAGSKLFFPNDLYGADEQLYTHPDTIYFKVLPLSGLGRLAEGSATSFNCITNQRQNRPYAPGDVKLDAQYFPASGNNTVTLTWVHRDRTQQLSTFKGWTESGIGPEVGVTYTVEWYNDDTSTLKQSTTGITGTSDTFLEAGANYNARVEIKSVRGGVESLDKFVHVFAYTADP